MQNSNTQIFLDSISIEFGNSKSLLSLHDPFESTKFSHLSETLLSGMVSTYGQESANLAEELKAYTGSHWCDVTSSGTVGLIAALEALNVRGKEVVTSNLSFYASTNAIILAGGIPFFIDIDLATMGLDPHRLEIYLSKFTHVKNNKLHNKVSGNEIAAILVPHLFGFLSNMPQLVSISKGFDVPIVEDAAEALGVFDASGKHAGTHGDLGVFSFNGNKVITSGGGGAIVGATSKHEETIERYLRGGRAKNMDEPTSVGTNGRMPALNAAFLRDQFDCLGQILEKKKQVHKTYRDTIESESLGFVLKDPNTPHSNYWLNLLEFDSEKNLLEFMEFTNGRLATRRLWRPFSEIPAYKHYGHFGAENASFAYKHFVSIASSPNLVP
ncbi:MAG: hypothetical protein RL589_45 [Actinomycetota bacterium]